jgi:hypothetical protein
MLESTYIYRSDKLGQQTSEPQNLRYIQYVVVL